MKAKDTDRVNTEVKAFRREDGMIEFNKNINMNGISVVEPVNRQVYGYILTCDLGHILYATDDMAATSDELRQIADKLDELNEVVK